LYGCVSDVVQLSVEERQELLCRVVEKFSGLEVIQRPELLARRRLEPRYVDMHRLDLALTARREDVKHCCAQVGSTFSLNYLNYGVKRWTG
jgi:hypothetical protein